MYIILQQLQIGSLQTLANNVISSEITAEINDDNSLDAGIVELLTFVVALGQMECQMVKAAVSVSFHLLVVLLL